MNWDEASDFEVNKRLAELLGLKIFNDQFASLKLKAGSVLVFDKNKKYGTKEINYCNNWQDIGPMIESKFIKVEPLCDTDPSEERWYSSTAVDTSKTVSYWHANPKRAAAICAIKLLESEK